MSEEDFIFCPLECGARIKNIGKHIKKCKNYSLLGVNYRFCEYNITHIIKNELYQTHLLSCRSKKKFEEDKQKSESESEEDLKDKFNDDSENEKEIEVENNVDNNNEIKNNPEKIAEKENEENNIKNRKRRYRHEKALFKDENEIDQECLDFFNKVYV